ncbi:MMPL family transporter [Streptomyces iranensis]|uniref:MMPL domain-containing protein n=1 Tax=Streptomyces iranensis TaxID=576784 RepID=A0A060ZVA7_9ACTN|nr:MMPL family transporter [Streptomyces iranensis]MBP2061466.1 RND superfamily putative drug exporter [Streptomyces iranensis]CDR09716.1 MMPL domain-containing protein [Streptomyces iranensis]
MTDVNRPPDDRIGGWTRLVTARPRLSLLIALIFTALAVVAGSGVADRMGSGGWEDPASESAYATKALEKRFPASQPNLILLVDSGKKTVDDPAVAAEARSLTKKLSDEKAVTGVTSYWTTGAPSLRARDRGEAIIAARILGDESAAGKALERIAPHYRGAHGPVEVRVGGMVAVRHELQSTIQEDLLRAEMIALPITLVLLVMVFGSAVAALLPLGVGIIAILGTDAVLRGLTELTDVSVFAQNLTTALGLGLAIDYALFIVRRFREELGRGAEKLPAVAATLRTAGRTVLFSALTVAASLAAMLVFPQYFLRSFAYAGIAVVLIAATAALVVLPAALILLGDRVNALDLTRLLRRGRPARGGEPGAGWARLARLVMRRAPVFALATVAGLVALGLPFLRVEFGTADDRQLPSSAESHVVQQHVREGFPGGPGGAVEVLAEGTGSGTNALADYSAKVSALPQVLRVDSPAGRFADGRRVAEPGPAEAARLSDGSAEITVQPKGEAVDTASQDLVRTIRAQEPSFTTSATGTAAVLVDTKDSIADRLPWAAAIIVAVTLLLVFLLTGSVLIPIQAVLLNALSLTAMFGAVVWVFQDGHLSGPLSFTTSGDIETTLPVLMFCVAFGLSMDYGVFLLSRIKEEYDRTGDHQAAVEFGLRRTGGLITAAALILAVVMVGIGTSRVTNTKMLGLGIALAVLMDAMVVRGLLVPAVMKLTGRATWWAPGPLRRLHTRFGLSEGESTPAERRGDSGAGADAATGGEADDRRCGGKGGPRGEDGARGKGGPRGEDGGQGEGEKARDRVSTGR